ncbi:XRE family transcriptional regulator [bacterium]|nr:XRE family transcriptional regulator [bacterium]
MTVSVGSDSAGACLAMNMRHLRKESALSQEQLSERSGVPRSTIASLERGEGNPTLLVLMGISQGLGVTIADLLLPRHPRAALFRSEQHGRLAYPSLAADGLHPNKIVETLRLTPAQARYVVIEEIVLNEKERILSNPHPSGTEEFFFLVEGACEVDLGGETYPVATGDLLRFDGNQNHIYCAALGVPRARGFAVVVQAPRV